MEKYYLTYYLTKAVVSLPCMGLAPLGVYATWLGIVRADYGVAVVFAVLTAIYAWFVWHFCSPIVNQAFIKSAESPKRFVMVNTVITLVFTMLIFFAGAGLWPLLHPMFVWLGSGLLDIVSEPSFEFMWVYFCAFVLFHLVYLGLWEYLRKYRWIRRLTIPNVCW